MKSSLAITDGDPQFRHPTTQLTCDHVLVRGVPWEQPGRVGVGSGGHPESALDVCGEEHPDRLGELDRVLAESDGNHAVAFHDIRGVQPGDPRDRLGEEHDQTADHSIAKRNLIVGEEPSEHLVSVAC